MLVGPGRGLRGLWRQTWPHHLSLTPFDPFLIRSGSNDRCVDALVETCAVLTAYGLVDLADGGAVQPQYREITQFCKRRWASAADELPVIEDNIALWMSYPHWKRCVELHQVVDLVFSVVVTCLYRSALTDDENGALVSDELASSFVRS